MRNSFCTVRVVYQFLYHFLCCHPNMRLYCITQ
uniref:Uncharacterized protein n=1 Tax=Arundo donax TaxID=35708 RepID=A0A0A8XP58_ARUDO